MYGRTVGRLTQPGLSDLSQLGSEPGSQRPAGEAAEMFMPERDVGAGAFGWTHQRLARLARPRAQDAIYVLASVIRAALLSKCPKAESTG